MNLEFFLSYTVQNVIYDEPNAGVDNEGTPKKHRRRKKKTAEDDDFLSAPDSEVEAETADDGDLEDPTDLLLPGQSIQHGVSKGKKCNTLCPKSNISYLERRHQGLFSQQ